MITLSWAIVVAAFILMPERNAEREGYEINAATDMIMFLGAAAMLVYWSFKG